jgi:hypothetical protein
LSKLKTYVPPSTSPQMTAPRTQFAYKPINILDPGDRNYLDTSIKVSRFSSRDAWDHYERIGEVHYGIDRTAFIAGYGRLFAQRVNAKGEATSSRDEGVLADIVAGIYSPFGGTRALLERADTLMRVPGEGYLIRVREKGEKEHDGYWILSPDEIQSANLIDGKPEPGAPLKWMTATTTGTDGMENHFIREVAPEDFLGRIWNPSKRFVDMVNSPMAALRGECEELIALTDSIMGRLRSRFALAGLLLVPSQMNDVNIAGPTPTQEHSNKILSFLIAMMTRNVMNHDQAYAHIPGILMGPAEVLDQVRHLVLDTAIDERDIQLRAELIGRILTGLDIQKAQAQSNEDSNHWNAWTNAEDERRIAVQPKLEALCWTFTRAILHKELKERKWEPGKITPWRVWFDLSEASTQINQAENFRLAWELGQIGDDAARRSIGAVKTDAPTPEEKVRWAGWVTKDPYLLTFGLDGKDGIAIDWDKVGASKKPPGPTSAGGEGGKVGPGSKPAGSPSSRDSDTPKAKEPE